MKSTIPCFILLLGIATIGCAATKEYTILTGQTIKAKVQNGMPVPAEKGGIKVAGAGFGFGDGKLFWGFSFRSKKPPTKVVVEDVSGRDAVVLVEDEAPKFDGHGWTGNTGSVSITRKDCPWLFELGDTTKVFRFTVTLKGKPEAVVIYQPAVYPETTKQLLRQMAK